MNYFYDIFVNTYIIRKILDIIRFALFASKRIYFQKCIDIE